MKSMFKNNKLNKIKNKIISVTVSPIFGKRFMGILDRSVVRQDVPRAQLVPLEVISKQTGQRKTITNLKYLRTLYNILMDLCEQIEDTDINEAIHYHGRFPYKATILAKEHSDTFRFYFEPDVVYVRFESLHQTELTVLGVFVPKFD
jgi:hypothetical protein